MKIDVSGKKEVSSKFAFWMGEIEQYEQQFSSWTMRSKKIVKRYKDDREEAAKTASQFNILWSNVQILHPAIYDRPPTPNIDRRWKDKDDLGRYASMVLERSVSYFVKSDIFDAIMRQTTLDRLLSGRGTSWVRYCPIFEEKSQLTDDQADDYMLQTETVIPDYVHWQDFGHTFTRTWEELRGVWRRVYMGRAELVKRFGEEKGNEIPLTASIKDSTGKSVESGKKACIYEIWDKYTKTAIWLNRDMTDIIEEREDPLELKDFFPCPKPVYATLTNDDLVPTPDYIMYQDQARELDNLTARISLITKAIKVAGIYDASAEGIDRLLSEGVENKLIPVKQFAMLGNGAGIDGIVSFFPLEKVVATLKSLYEARERVKQDLYEITGISDIIRGASNANETATAQQIKGQYASLRLDTMQKDVARFSRDLVVIMTEIIAKHFSLDTLKKLSGVKLLTAIEKQQIQMQQMIAQQTGQQLPIPDEVAKLMKLPTWEEVEALIKDDTARSFRIDIETDSTIKADQEAEKQSRIELLGAVSGFIQQAATVPPEMRKLAMDLLLFGVRGFKISREIETSFEEVEDQLRQAEDQPPQPDPQEQIAAREAEIQKAKFESDMALTQAKAQADLQKANIDLAIKNADIELKKLDLMIKNAEIENKTVLIQTPPVG